METVRLTAVVLTDSYRVTEDGDGAAVYGLRTGWSDGSQVSVPDLGTDRNAVACLARTLAGSGLGRAHFEDVIEDFLS